jgi:hypothetical protein
VNLGRLVLRRNPKLMPQDQDLQVFGAVIGVGEDQQAVSRRTVSQSMKSIAG